MRNTIRKHWLYDIFFLAVLFAAVVAWVVIYVKQERFFYYFDWGGYQDVVIDLVHRFFAAPRSTLVLIRDSVELEYNYFFALPLIPLVKIFGSSRLGYVLSLGIVYQFPYILACATLITRLVATHKRLTFWFAALLALVNPLAWAPTLRGYPDVGAALIILSALWIALYDLELKAWWQIVSIGILTALAILFRRHFAYGVAAFYLALTFQLGWLSTQKVRQKLIKPWSALLMVCGRVLAASAVSFVTLWLIARPLLKRAFTVDYLDLYASYVESPRNVLYYFFVQYGWIIWLLVATGIFASIALQVTQTRVIFFVGMVGSLSLITWAFAARQFGVHYTLHTTFFVLTGLSALAFVIFRCFHAHRLLLLLASALYVTLLAVNAYVGFSYVEILPALRSALPRSYPPLTRPNYDTVVHLVDVLRTTVSPQSPIYVADSSYLMNFNLLQKAERALYGWEQPLLNVLETPQADSRDFYPLELLLQADYVIVTTPYQFHMRPEEQQVVQVVVDAFEERWEFAEDFVALPEQFPLEAGAVLHIYHRIRTTGWQTAIRTFDAMRKQVGIHPGSQLNWISLDPRRARVSYQGGIYSFDFNPGAYQGVSPVAFLYSDVAPDDGLLAGSIDFKEDACAGVSLEVRMIDGFGRMLDSETVKRFPPQTTFELPFQGNGSSYLAFFVDVLENGPVSDLCSATLGWNLIRE